MPKSSTQNPAPGQNHTPSRALDTLLLLASLAAGLGAAACLYVALTAAEQVLWGSAGFLFAMLIATTFGVLAGIGKFRAGVGMATVATASTILGGAIFAWRDLASNLGRDAAIGPKLLPWLGYEAICALVILLAGATMVLARRPRAWGAVTKALAFLVPAGILLAVGYLNSGKFAAEDSGRAIALAVLLVGGAVIGTLISIGGHHLIRAFEMTAEDPAASRS